MHSDLMRLALVGCGRQMRQNLVPFLQRIPGHEIVACVDPNLAAAKEVAVSVGASVAVETIDVLDVEGLDLDAAVLAVPPEPSCTLASQLVPQGLHCFVEKPAGHSTEALHDLRTLVEARDRWVQVGFNFRYAETLVELHDRTLLLRSDPCFVTIDFCSRHPSAPQWGVDTTIEAWVRHNGIHAFDLARWFVPSPVTEVSAGVIECAGERFMGTVTLAHENGSLSTLRVGNWTKRFQIGVTVQTGDGSRLAAPTLWAITSEFEHGVRSGAVVHETRNLDDGWARSGFGPELEHFIAACRGAGDPAHAPSVADAWAGSALIDDILGELARPDRAAGASGRRASGRRAG